MKSEKLRLYNYLFGAFLLVLLIVKGATAQTDPNPDSPIPILISEPKNFRALVINADKPVRGNPAKVRNTAFALGSKAIIYVTNLNLMENEGANAFRVNVEDARGKKYRFPVLDIQPLENREWVYALTISLKDQLNSPGKLQASGDVLIGVSWRGLTSNRLRLGLGKTGGTIKDDANAITFPLPDESVKSIQNADEPEAGDYRFAADRTRFLEQATFGPTAELDRRIRRIGLQTWLAEQFDAPYPTVPYPEIPLMPTNEPLTCNGTENPNTTPPDPADIYPECRRDRYTVYPLQNWFFKEAFYGEAQLRHRVAWALSQMWVVSGLKTTQSSHMIAYHKVLSRNAFGNYRTLMQEMTLNPGMGNYLDMMRSTREQTNENYARELLQLFTVGVVKLNQDGTVQLDSNNKPLLTYDQSAIFNFTLVFTGWTSCETAECPNRTIGAPNYKDPMILNQANHNITAKTLLSYPNAVNQNIAPNTNGNVELEQTLDNIYNHPNVAPFVSRYLIQHLVTSDPTPAYVGRISAVFNANRTSPTQLREVVRAILLDPEARGNVKTDPEYGKLREPIQLATNVYRQFGVRAADGSPESDGSVTSIISSSGQNAFYAPTVFNYYSPDYIVPGSGINGPEFGIMTTGTAIARTNFINTIVFNRINPDTNSPNGTSIDLTEMHQLVIADPTLNQLLDTLNTKMLHGTMSAQYKEIVRTAVQTVPRTNPLLRARMAIYLIATSSQYQVQK